MKDKSSKLCSISIAKAALTLGLLCALNLLLGCQGISAGGTGIKASAGSLAANLAGISFGNVTIGKTQTISGSITNSGGSSVSISTVSISGAGFTLGGLANGATVAAGQSANFSVQFSPTTAGTSNGTISITSNASNATLTVPVSGVGTSAVGTLSSNPTSLSFSSTTVGQNQSLSETITNSGSASVSISQISVSGAGFSLVGAQSSQTLTAGQSTTFSVKFAPTSAGSATGTLTVSSDASNPSLTVAVSGTGAASPGQLGSNPTSLNFGSVTVGSSQSLSATITNSGGSSVSISNVAINGSGYTLSGITTPLTLTSGQSTTFTVKFAPSSSGTANGTVTVTSDASNPSFAVSLTGTGTMAVGTVTISPSPCNLGSVQVGSSGSVSGKLSASAANVTVTNVSSNNSVFSVSGLSLPVTIAAGQNAPFTITFSPTATGSASATLTVTSNASPTTTTLSCTGTATAATTHSVNLSWNASTSSNISGYNIYRALYASSTCGSYGKINGLVNTTTLYTDSTVVNGNSYCYAATAVNTSNQESSYSNIVTNVQIP